MLQSIQADMIIIRFLKINFRIVLLILETIFLNEFFTMNLMRYIYSDTV